MVLMKQFKEDNTVSRQKTSASKTAKATATCSQDSCNRPHGHTVDRVALWKIKNSKRKGMPCQECDTDYDIKTKSIAMEDGLEAIGQTSPAEEQTKKRGCYQGCPSKGNKTITIQPNAK